MSGTAKHVRPCVLPGVEDIGFYRRLRARQIPPEEHLHGPDRFEIAYLKTGRQTFTVNGLPDALVGGDVRLVFPRESHGIRDVAEDRHLMFFLILRLDTPGLLSLAPPMDNNLKDLLLGIDGHKFRAPETLGWLFPAAIAELERATDDNAAALRAQTYIMAILMECERCSVKGERKVGLLGVARVVKAVRANPQQRWTLAHFARISRMSPATFRRHFLSHTGEPPRDFVQRCRIERAGEILRAHPEISITDQALNMGFSSSQHFATVFRRFKGASPREYRDLSS